MKLCVRFTLFELFMDHYNRWTLSGVIMKLLLSASVLIFLMSGQNTLAQDKPNGNTLLQQCNAAVRRIDAIKTGGDPGNALEQQAAEYCVGYINGFVDADERHCPPEGVTMQQYIRVIIKFLNDHPEKLHLGRAHLVDEALGSAFPCQK